MPITEDQLRNVAGGGGNVVTTAGDKIGRIGQIYLDDQTGEPNFVTVKTGLFGTAQSFVPLHGADIRSSDIVVDFDKDTVKDAPRIDDDGSISPDQEEQLYSYYGLQGRADANYSGTPSDLDDPSEAHDNRPDQRGEPGIVGRDTSGPTTDDAMTRSEERLRVGTQQRESGRARLRKYVVTENVTETVPVRREEVRLEREPITDANIGDAMAGPDISEEEHEVVLHEERPVVEKDAVPVERVRLDTEAVTEQVTVNEEVRKEQIDTDVDQRPRR
jgi:uncharacterized protein (TIGR02271 family)